MSKKTLKVSASDDFCINMWLIYKNECLDLVTSSDYMNAILIGLFSTLLLTFITMTIAWVYYAYRNPTSASGIWLIEVSFGF
jgi:hypothetical protein